MTEEETNVQKECMKAFLKQTAKKIDMADLSELLADECVIMIPDDTIHGFVVLGKKAASFKPGNICFDLKRAGIMTAEWAATSAKPDSFENAVRLIITTAIWISRITKTDISETEASLLAWMHNNNLYDRLEEEQKVISLFYEYYCTRHPGKIEIREIEDAIKNLYEIKCIDIVNGKICLCEKVWGSR